MNHYFLKRGGVERKVEVDYSKDLLIDGDLEYSADKVKKTDSQIFLKGNARIFDVHDTNNLEDDESIEADEIVINLK